MRKIVNALIVLPLALIFVAFAVANRHFVTLSFDPFNSSDPAVALTLPLFVVVIAMAALGVIAGSVATWFGQRRWRRAARRHEADAQEARTRLADLQAAMSMPRNGDGRVPAVADGTALPSPYAAAIGRDKHGATL